MGGMIDCPAGPCWRCLLELYALSNYLTSGAKHGTANGIEVELDSKLGMKSLGTIAFDRVLVKTDTCLYSSSCRFSTEHV